MVIAFIIAVSVILIDQITKIVIMNTFSVDETKYLIKDFLFLTKVYNKGAGWSILSDKTIVLVLVSLIASAVIIYLIIKYFKMLKENILLSISCGLILGGTVGNLIDRFLTVIKQREGVVDFVGMWIGNYQWPVWNIADAALVVGIILIAVWGILFYGKKGDNDENDIQS